jgi:hypothetical protein
MFIFVISKAVQKKEPLPKIKTFFLKEVGYIKNSPYLYRKKSTTKKEAFLKEQKNFKNISLKVWKYQNKVLTLYK